MKIKNYDFVIVSSPPLFTGMIGVFLQKFKSVPFWLDLRDIWPDSAMVLKQIKKNRIYFSGSLPFAAVLCAGECFDSNPCV